MGKDMGDFKRTERKESTIITLKAEKGQFINAVDVNLTNSGLLKRIIGVTTAENGKRDTLEWNITGMVSLKDYLNMVPLNGKMFLDLVAQIVSLIYEADENELDTERIVFDIEAVMLIPSTAKMMFIYVPIRPYRSDTGIKDLLGQILLSAEYSVYRNHQYMNEFMDIMNSDELHLNRLEEYLSKYRDNIDRNAVTSSMYGGRKRCPNCQCLIENSSAFCPACGNKLKNESKCPYLVRNDGKEKIDIVFFPFVIGKVPEGVNYFVKGNSTISRKHAQLIKQGQKYYITDLSSTNGTYVAGRRVLPGELCELKNNDIIKLSNEIFIFYTE